MKNIKVENDGGNIIFDNAMEDCHIQFHETQGKLFAFVQALDIGHPHARLSKPHRVRYWGSFDPYKQEESIIDILHTGSGWPYLNNHK